MPPISPPHLRPHGAPLWLLALCACAPPPPPARPAEAPAAPAVAAGTVLAQVGACPITDAQLMAYEGLVPTGSGQPAYPQLLAKVEDRVRFELLAQAAAARGLRHDPDVVEATRKAMVRKLLAADMAAARLGADLPEEALRAYFDQHHGDFAQPELRRFATVRFGNDPSGHAQAEAFARSWHAAGDEARALAAAQALQLAPRPAAAGAEAARPRRRRAALRWHEEPFQRQQDVARSWGPQLAATLFAADPSAGATTVVATAKGPVAVRMLARRQPEFRSFAEARQDIAEQLVRGRRSQFFQRYLDDLRRSYPIAIYEDRLRAWLQRPPAPMSAPAGGVPDAAGLLP